MTFDVHVSDTAGTYVGTRAVLLQWPNSGGGDVPDSWVPLCNPQIDPRTGKLIGLVNGSPPVGETFCNEFGSAVSVVPFGLASRAAWSWFDTRDSQPTPSLLANDRVDVWGASVQPGAPYDLSPETMDRITPISGSTPWTPTATNGNTWWGDYQGATAPWTEGAFHPFWADNRFVPPTANVATAEFGP